MPIRPENRARYPQDWAAISTGIRVDRAGGRCECRGECGHDHLAEFDENPAADLVDDLIGTFGPDFLRCLAENGRPHPVTGSGVVLTVAHLNHQPEDCREENLRAMCQRCHLAYDRRLRPPHAPRPVPPAPLDHPPRLRPPVQTHPKGSPEFIDQIRTEYQIARARQFRQGKKGRRK